MFINNNNKKSEDETRINFYLITDLLLPYDLLLLILAFELQRPIFGQVPCEFQQRQDHSFYKENNPIIWMVDILIFVLLQCKSVEQILWRGHPCQKKGTNSLWIWVTINKIRLAIFLMIFLSQFSKVGVQAESSSSTCKTKKIWTIHANCASTQGKQ